MLRSHGLEGGGELPKCVSCSEADGALRCRDCTGFDQYCNKCILESHRRLPLHRLEVPIIILCSSSPNLLLYQVWNGRFFEQKSLADAGLIVHLGHHGAPCPTLNAPHKKEFIVVHTSGIHRVHLAFCRCYHAGVGYIPHYAQLLRIGWFPSTEQRVSSAFSMAVLDFFLEQTHQGKTNMYDFYRGLERLNDPARVYQKPTVSFNLDARHPSTSKLITV